MIAERPDIGACTCRIDAPDRCVWSTVQRRWVGPCTDHPTRVELTECTDPTCYGAELGVGLHYHRTTDGDPA